MVQHLETLKTTIVQLRTIYMISFTTDFESSYKSLTSFPPIINYSIKLYDLVKLYMKNLVVVTGVASKYKLRQKI